MHCVHHLVKKAEIEEFDMQLAAKLLEQKNCL